MPYADPIDKKINNSRLNPRRIRFAGKHILLSYNPRIGECSKCKRNIDNDEINLTHMHHDKGYITIFPWYGMIELCNRCHGEIPKRRRILAS